ncbi:disease resistance protein RGA2-like [Macadamia integrifolia]|uniref:disease resistance protein RGA2-like n=1 Tax=Macadamia integrifolia TaxID=60698 RepID=UPI001C4EC39B|nr:disease resistance protein RGA2-like [Macadamia integrifolia]XP_042500606.1 disease resistance protein RGA2-like [Macadamia integrifolia]XP_042500615.1 disease resistance protein RGA2-like [Macadamia integrifolia]XP_042500624.1 disease resistance protein RGA2-like [Macadamia integrifolia]XP_042500631.1 disease resistance protein RGA2-like [Macadamia integrifolia]
MVDALVSSVMQQLGTIIQKEVEQEVRLVVGVKKEVKKLSHTFTKIQAVLKDAEERQIKDNSVRLWLQDLKDVAYDIDDVLDEWSTEILKSQIEGVSSISLTKKVCPPSNLFSPCCFSFKKIGLRHDIGHRIKEINERVDEIATRKDNFHFIETTISRNEIIKYDEPSGRNLESSSIVDVSEVFGRDEDKNFIISKLVSEGSSTQQEMVSDDQEVSKIIISIAGMAGMGKTTLAQLVFNDDRVKNHFNKRMWVHVSKPFDKMKVAMRIIEEIGGGGGNINASQGGHHDIAWESVHRQLTSSVEGKHFLLVLDDVWNEDHSLWYPLWLSLKRGSLGSRIIVTTRNENVASMMGTTYIHKLGEMSDEGCWAALRYYAFLGRKKEESKQLKEIGMKLANKCKGLPLSAKTLGSLLHLKKSKQDWQYILESDVWKQPILPALLLSYNDLPSHLKQCFAYCSITPRDYCFEKLSTVREWIAQGFLGDSLATGCGDLFKVGDECFNSLVIRSFFQKNINYSKGIIEYYGMHDLVHNFANSLVENECFTFTTKDTIAQESNFSRARHLSPLTEEISMIPSSLYKMKNLRTLIIYGKIPIVSFELFGHLTCLRTLHLGETYLEELPNEIEKLIHLRYLNLCVARFRELPKSVTNLYNLSVLCLGGCTNLCKLPEGIGGLVNLMDLDLTECCQLSYLPEGIGRLSRMRRLSDFIIGGMESGGCKIGELKYLNFLKDSLRIIGLGRVENGDEAKLAFLKNKQHLRALYFYFNQYTGVSIVDEEGDDEALDNQEKEEAEAKAKEKAGVSQVDDGGDILSRRMEDVLGSLEPHRNLEKLTINDYLGVAFPNWMCSHADFVIFSNLVFLQLYNCRNCKRLPPTLGKLPFLEILVIGGMDKVKLMGVEFFGINHGVTKSDSGVDAIFPKLKVFQLSEMLDLEEWNVRIREEEGKGFVFMPCLQYLVLAVLPKLSSFLQHLTQVTSLRKLFIWECPKLNSMSSSLSSHLPVLHVEELILKMNAGSFSKSLVSNNHMFLPKLKLLRVRQSPYSSLHQGLGQLTTLEILDIRTCSKIKSIPEEELEHLTALRELRIMRCPSLRQRCRKEEGEDWRKISHIPNIFFDDEKIK